MHPAKKLFCRTYQISAFAVLPILPYSCPEIYKSIEQIPSILKKHHISSVLLVTDGFLRSTKITSPLETLLAENEITCTVYDRTCPNPTVINVEEARTLYLENKCQGLIAFGGGSAIDCAKAVGARIARPNKPLSRMKGILKILRKIPPLIAVPTTAGTGSETTLAAVITDFEKHHKYPINDFTLIPKYAVLDAEVTRTLPPHLTATTGMDALTHAVEAYIGRSSTKETRAYALEAVSLIFRNIERAYVDGNDTEARNSMLLASHLAGRAFTKSYVGYIHAVAHSLGGQYNIPHGLANAVLLPVGLEIYGDAVYKKLKELGVAAGVSSHIDTDKEGAEKFITAIRGLNFRMQIPETLCGIKRDDIPMMAKYAEREANPLYPVPVLFDAEGLEEFYLRVSA